MIRPRGLGSQVWSLLSLGVGLNLVLGALVAAFKLPVYLDSLGTVLVASLAGPIAGALAGGCGVALLGLTSPTALAFLPVGVAVGLLAGWLARIGAFRRASTALLAGGAVGVAGAALAAPISATLFGGVTGGGTDLMVALFRAGGMNPLQAAFSQGLAVDPLDKAVTFLLVYTLLRALPARATSAFPLADKLPAAPQHRPSYQPITSRTVSRSSGSSAPAEREAGSAEFAALPAEAGWKALSLVSVLLAAGLTSDLHRLAVGTFALWLAYLVNSWRLTLSLTRKLLLGLAPLGLSLVAINGLIGRSPEEPAVWAMGLAWSPQGLGVALGFGLRMAMMLLALSFFLETTPLRRQAELLRQCRVPYPLIFVLLTGSSLAGLLRDRWRVVEQAQQARGLQLHPPGLVARVRVLLGLLVPTLGAVFSEIPQRAANLESRGFLNARPRHAVPLAWTGEAPPSAGGRAFYLLLAAGAWVMLLWP